MEELKKPILKEYHITEEQLDEIFYEGINKKMVMQYKAR